MATDPFNKKVTTVDQPARSAVAVTPSDTIDLAMAARSLYIGVQGDLTVIMAGDSTDTPVLYTDIKGFAPIMIKRVMATGTTATDILALY